MDANKKGNVGVSKAISWFLQSGYEVCLPFGDVARYDLVIEKNGKMKTVQCKYTSSISSAKNLIVRSRCTKGGKSISYNKADADFLFVVCSSGDVYLFPGNLFWGRSSITLCNRYNKYKIIDEAHSI